MTYAVPFTEESVRNEICERVMCLGNKRVGHYEVEDVIEVVLGEEGANWNVENGVLYILDKKGTTTHVMNGVQVENGVVFLSGDVMRQAGRDRVLRVVMYERSALGTDFHVVISSHVDYEKVTLPRLIRSLEREGVPDDRVTVVVGGSTEEEEPTKEKGYRRVPVPQNFMGCTAFAYLLSEAFTQSSTYVLLMHDTCEVSPGFGKSVKMIDVGLPFDVVEGSLEIGLWSKNFLGHLASTQGLDLMNCSAYNIFKVLKDICRLTRKCGGPTLLRSKDVYGTGTKRTVSEIGELGIRKFAGSSMTGGRP